MLPLTLHGRSTTTRTAVVLGACLLLFGLPSSGCGPGGGSRPSAVGPEVAWETSLSYPGGDQPQSSPHIEWQTSFGGPGVMDQAWSVEATPDGGCIVAGRTSSYGQGGADAWIVKIDAAGEGEWHQTIGGPDSEWASCIAQTSDGGYVVAGATCAVTRAGRHSDCWLALIDPRGETMWSSALDGPGLEFATSVQQTADGGFIVAGSTEAQGGFLADFLLIKTDRKGKQEWAQTFGGPAVESAMSVVQTTDGGYLIAGESKTLGVSGYDLWLVKTDAEGRLEWDRSFSSKYGYWSMDVAQTPDGGFIIAYAGDLRLLKIDGQGEEEWSTGLGRDDPSMSLVVEQTPDGGFLTLGITYSDDFSDNELWLVKADAMGNEEWSRTFPHLDFSFALSARWAPDGAYFAAGVTGPDCSEGFQNCDSWVVKLR